MDDPGKGTDVPYRNPEASRCTALRGDGQFCDGEPIPDAPFPICVKHAARLLKFLDDVMPRDRDDRMIAAMRMVEQDRQRETRRQRPKTEVVYYVHVGRHVKIGYSSDLPARIRAYPPDSRLLGYEYGGPSLEAQRHREFADELRMGREWFAPSDRLMTHISHVNVRRQAA